MGYHKAYLKADAAKRNLDLDKYMDGSSDSDSSGAEDSLNNPKNVSPPSSPCRKYVCKLSKCESFYYG